MDNLQKQSNNLSSFLLNNIRMLEKKQIAYYNTELRRFITEKKKCWCERVVSQILFCITAILMAIIKISVSYVLVTYFLNNFFTFAVFLNNLLEVLILFSPKQQDGMLYYNLTSLILFLSQVICNRWLK